MTSKTVSPFWELLLPFADNLLCGTDSSQVHSAIIGLISYAIVGWRHRLKESGRAWLKRKFIHAATPQELANRSRAGGNGQSNSQIAHQFLLVEGLLGPSGSAQCSLRDLFYPFHHVEGLGGRVVHPFSSLLLRNFMEEVVYEPEGSVPRVMGEFYRRFPSEVMMQRIWEQRLSLNAGFVCLTVVGFSSWTIFKQHI